MTIRDIQIIQEDKAAQQEPRRNFTLAVIREVEGSVFYPYQPMHVWVSEWAQPQSYFGILNLRVPPMNGLQVMIGYPEKPPYTRQILDVWGGLINLPGYDPGDGGGTFSLPMHHVTHEQPSDTVFGSDVVRVYQPAIQPLKSFADGSTLIINVQSLRYWSAASNFRIFPGIGLDMTANLPAVAGTHHYVLIYIDRSSNTIARLEGTAVPLADTPPFPQLPDSAIPSAFILLAEGQTTIDQSTDVVDARAFLGNYDVPGMDVFQWIWTDEADRLATVVSSSDLYRIGLQIDDWTVWVLADDDPVTWEAIGGGASGDFVLKAGDTMTGQLFIDGGADEVQLLVQGDAAQSVPILTVENSAGDDLFTVNNDGEIQLAIGVPIDEFSDDVTLGDDSSTALPTEHAVKTYVDAAIASGPYVLTAGDTMTGQLFIDGGDDEVQLLVQGDVGQASPIIVIEDGAGADLFTIGEGVLIGAGTVPTAGSLTIEDEIRIGTLTAGRIPFVDTAGLLADSADLVWIDASSRLGVGTGSPDGKIHAVEDDYPVMLSERTSNVTTSQLNVNSIKHTTSGDMADGFGPQILFEIRDDAAVDNVIAGFGAVRHGADNQGKLRFRVNAALTLAMTIDSGARVGIGTDAPATSALLELSSTTGALLLPRMTTTQRDALTAVNGMILYNSTTNTVQARAGGAWVNL